MRTTGAKERDPMSDSTPRRKRLPVNPSIEHLKKQAKRLARDRSAPLAHAQHALAQEYGCKSWAELTHVVQTMNRGANTLVSGPDDGKPRYQPLPAAVRNRDVPAVQAILASGQYTVHDLDQGLAHAAWYGGSNPDILNTRKHLFDLLLAHGADPDGEYGGNYGPIVFGTGECLSHEGLQWLLDAGCDVTFKPVPTKYGSHCPLSMVLGGYDRGNDNTSKHRMIRTLLAHHAYIPAEVSPPILAIHMGQADILATLLDQNPSLLNQTFPDMPYGNLSLKGAGLLHCAVEFCEIPCLDILLDRHADPNLKANFNASGGGGQTPIYHAIGSIHDGNFDTLQHFVKRLGSKIDMTVTAILHREYCDPTPNPVTPLGYALHMAGPAASGILNTRKKIPQERALLESIHHGPALISAAKTANLPALQSLVAQGVSVDYQDASQNTALWYVAGSSAPDADRLACVSFLLDQGAKPNRQHQHGASAYHIAARTGPAALVKLFQDKGALSWTSDPKGQRALEYAQNSPTLSPVEKQTIVALIEKPRITDPHFADAVRAIDAGNLPRLQSLLKTHPYLATAKADEPGSYAGPYFAHPGLLCFVAENPTRNNTLPSNISDIATAIIDAGATSDDISRTLGMVCSGNVPRETNLQAPLIKILLARGADSAQGLDAAITHQEHQAIKTLLELGVVPDARVAVSLGDLPSLEKLLAGQPDSKILTQVWKIAAGNGNVDALKLLLAKGVDIHTVDMQNATALHHAALGNHKEAVIFLLQHGARRDILDNQFNGTPSGWAQYGGGHKDLAQFINNWSKPPA